jgi:DUF917 family protein
MQINLSNMSDFARGAAFLGAGGGGDPHLGRLFCETAIREYGAPKVVSLDDLDPDANVYTIAMMGAPTVIVEKLICGDDAVLAIKKLEQITGRPATALMPIEIGGINSTLPIAVAARLGLPVVDADGMGRAFPELQMTTFNVYGVPLSPFVLVDEHLESVVIEARDGNNAEHIARAVAMQMGLAVMISCYPMKGADAKRAGIGGTMNAALGIGRAIAEGRRSGDPVQNLLSYLRTTPYYHHCREIFDGKIVDLLRETTRGFSIGRCTLEALDHSQSRLEIAFQNENLMARQDGRLRAMVPDLICIVDRETAEPITTEALKFGVRVKVIAASVAPAMRTPQAIDCFGPRAFGFDEDFVPIEHLG